MFQWVQDVLVRRRDPAQRGKESAHGLERFAPRRFRVLVQLQAPARRVNHRIFRSLSRALRPIQSALLFGSARRKKILPIEK